MNCVSLLTKWRSFGLTVMRWCSHLTNRQYFASSASNRAVGSDKLCRSIWNNNAVLAADNPHSVRMPSVYFLYERNTVEEVRVTLIPRRIFVDQDPQYENMSR